MVKSTQARDMQMRALSRAKRTLLGAGFHVIVETASRDRTSTDLVVERSNDQKTERYLIELIAPRPATVESVRAATTIMANRRDVKGFWILSWNFSDDAETIDRPRSVRLIKLGEFESFVRRLTKASTKKGKKRVTPKTAIGKKVTINVGELTVALASLVLLIEERVRELQEERPNSPDAITARDKAIREYERMRRDVHAFANAIERYKLDNGKELEVVKASNAFADGVRKWWNTSHSQICEKAYDLGLFGTAVAICSMAGAGGNMAVAVSAALVGGKPVAEVLKAIGKKLLG